MPKDRRGGYPLRGAALAAWERLHPGEAPPKGDGEGADGSTEASEFEPRSGRASGDKDRSSSGPHGGRGGQARQHERERRVPEPGRQVVPGVQRPATGPKSDRGGSVKACAIGHHDWRPLHDDRRDEARAMSDGWEVVCRRCGELA